MKGALGLTLAAGLGIIGALSNWFYLQRLASTEEKVRFIAIKNGVRLNVGDTIKPEHLVPVGVPRSSVDNLDSVAVKWSALAAVDGQKANRPLGEGDLILNLDIRGPSIQSMARSLAEDEVVRWVPIDAGTVVPEHINPGDLVSFDVPRIGGALPTPAGSSSGQSGSGSQGFGTSEIIGPFQIASLGARREPEDVARGSRRSSGSESRVAIVIKLEADGRLEPKGERLFEAIRLAGNQGVQVQLHSARISEK